MSVYLNAVGDYLASNGNQPSQTSHTFFMWCKFISTTAADRAIMVHYNNSSSQHWKIIRDSSGQFRFRANDGTTVWTGSDPTWTSWFAIYFIVNGGSVTCGWRQEGGTGWTTNTGTATTFTTFGSDAFRIGDGFTSADMEIRYMRQWDSVLSETDMTAEFQSTTIVSSSPLRNLPLAAGSSAGDDISANNYDMNATGLASPGGDGSSEPTITGPSTFITPNVAGISV